MRRANISILTKVGGPYSPPVARSKSQPNARKILARLHRLARMTVRTYLILRNNKRISRVGLRMIIAVDPVPDTALHAVLNPVCDPGHRLHARLLRSGVAALSLANLPDRGARGAAARVGFKRGWLSLLDDGLFVILTVSGRCCARRTYLRSRRLCRQREA